VLEVVQDKVMESPSEIEDAEEVKVSIIGLIDIIGSGVDEPPPPQDVIIINKVKA
jgi:hypothetical protein